MKKTKTLSKKNTTKKPSKKTFVLKAVDRLLKAVKSQGGVLAIGAASAFVLALAASLLDPIRDALVKLTYGDHVQIILPDRIVVDVGQVFKLTPYLAPTRVSTSSPGHLSVTYDGRILILQRGPEQRPFGAIRDSTSLDPFYFRSRESGETSIAFTVDKGRGHTSVKVVSDKVASREYITEYDYSGRWKANSCGYDFVITTDDNNGLLQGAVEASSESDLRLRPRFDLRGRHDGGKVEMTFGLATPTAFNSMFHIVGIKSASTEWLEFAGAIYETDKDQTTKLLGESFFTCLMERKKNNLPVNVWAKIKQ